MIVGEEPTNVANRTVLMTEFRVAHHHESDGFHAHRRDRSYRPVADDNKTA